jgi:hypothetical protein
MMLTRNRRAGVLLALLLIMTMVFAGSPAVAKPAVVDVEIDCDAGLILITSSKDLSNIVYSMGGEHFKLDDLYGYTFALDLEGIETVWVKSGNNQSGDGPGYGERFDIPEDACGPVDADGDGYPADVDCNDNDPNINPGAVDIPNNGIDENCDGSDLVVTEGELRVTLIWDTDDDLDLYVTDPFGDRVTYFSTSVASGGELDRDDNVGMCGADPEPGGVENIIWASNPPSGIYTVELSNYNDCAFGTSAAYTIQVFLGGTMIVEVAGSTDFDGFGGSANIVDSFDFSVP